jgi:hypothetical protein
MRDFLLDNDFDLLFVGGDLVIGQSDLQHQELLLLTEKGINREFPTCGVGIQTELNDERPEGLKVRIKREFERDGMRVEKVNIQNGTFQIEAYYE